MRVVSDRCRWAAISNLTTVRQTRFGVRFQGPTNGDADGNGYFVSPGWFRLRLPLLAGRDFKAG